MENVVVNEKVSATNKKKGWLIRKYYNPKLIKFTMLGK